MNPTEISQIESELPEDLKNGLDRLCQAVKDYHPDANLELLKKSYFFSANKHKNQKRSSGEPYMSHPLEVALILTRLKMDTDTLIAALLHDTVEDTGTKLEEVQELFGDSIRDLVDGVTKIGKITFRTSEEKQAENFRKMLMAMSQDIRVILIKLADRTHNMRTLHHLKETKQKNISKETLDIYAPIANRLGISWMKMELEDLCLRYLKPDIYYRLAQKVQKKKAERDRYIEDVCKTIEEKLNEYDVKGYVTGRSKHFYSIYRKMESRGVDYDQIHDIIAFRISLDNITECYKALGVIHATWLPIPGRFKDYIAMPKPNRYQSLHTTVIGPLGERVEIQIRTHDMNKVAEEGIAAHWAYKEGVRPDRAKEYSWIRNLLEFNQELKDPAEFLESVKTDLFAENIYVFTPAGDIKEMPFGATPLDFAYTIHTDVGNHCIGAKVNSKIVPLNHRMRSGDTIEILTSQTQTPSKDWLKIVKSPRAKSKIRNFIKAQERERSELIGKGIFEKELRKYGFSVSRVVKSSEINSVLESYSKKTTEDLYAMIGYGKVEVKDILLKMPKFADLVQEKNKSEREEKGILTRIFEAAKKKTDAKNAIIVDNSLSDILVRFGRCCNPIPGDPIVGFVTRGRGITVHSTRCSKALEADLERKIEVAWSKSSEVKRPVKVRVITLDEPGVLANLSKSITQSGFNITQAQVRTLKDGRASCVFQVEVDGQEALDKVMKSLMSRKEVIDVERIFS